MEKFVKEFSQQLRDMEGTIADYLSEPWSADSDIIGLRLEPRQEHVHPAQLVRTDNPLFDKVRKL